MSTERAEWHVDDEVLGDYAAGTTSAVLSTSVEAHLMGCEQCRAALGRVTNQGGRDAAWERLADAVDSPSGWWGSLIRSVVATPPLVQAAAGAVLLVAIVPLALGLLAGDAGLTSLLVLAPLAPVGAVALAYRDWADPAGEITRSLPGAGLRLVSLRAVLVSAVALPIAAVLLLIVGSWVDVPLGLAFAWCLPGFALAALVLLAGTTKLDSTRVAGVLSVGWAVTVMAGVTVRRSLRPEVLLDGLAQPGVQLSALVVAVGAAVLAFARRDAVAYRKLT